MRVHLIDGTYELYRAHFSPRPGHTDPKGRDNKAVVGLVSSLLALLHDPDEAVTHVAIAFDNPIRSFRNDLFAGYKGDEGVPPELRAQFDEAEEAARSLGMVVWPMRDFEADDALATAASRWKAEADQIRIMSPDKDLGQCLEGQKVVQIDRRQKKVMDEASLRASKGVGPGQIPDLLALTGDAADGIPGVPGFGDKGAAQVLSAFGSLEKIPLDGAGWPSSVRGAARLSATLRERFDDALLYRKLATLVTDAPLPESLADLRWAGVPRAAFEAFCEKAGSSSLRARPTRWA